MKASLELCLVLSSMAVYATTSGPNSGKNLRSVFLPNGIHSIPLGNLTLPNDLPMISGLPLPSELPITCRLPEPSGHSEPTGFYCQSKRQLFGITENGITTNNGCQPLKIIFVRETGKLGNMGIIVSPPVASAQSSLMGGKVTIQRIKYDACIAGGATAGADGGPTVARYVTQATQQCPDTKVVLVDYSKGEMVVHNAANALSTGQVADAVLLGGPFNMFGVGKFSASNVKDVCALGDPACENAFNVLAPISYGADANTAAHFRVQAAGILNP